MSLQRSFWPRGPILSAGALTFCVLGIALAGMPRDAEAVVGCPPLYHNFGPFDYRSIPKESLRMVEGAHFFPNVENLRKNTPHPNRGYIVDPGNEIDYTLRAIPNHPRALMAAAKLALQYKSDRPKGLRVSIDCYFLEALEFRADDSYVPLIYGIYLAKLGKLTEAIVYFDRAKSLGDDSANLHFNLGLAYFEAERYNEALDEAHKAYAAGFPLMGLKNKLMSKGKWKDQEPISDKKIQPVEESKEASEGK